MQVRLSEIIAHVICVRSLDVRAELSLRGEDLLALEAAVRPGLAVDAGGVPCHVAPPGGRIVTLVASEGRFAVLWFKFHALLWLRGNILGGCQVRCPFFVVFSQMDGTNMLH